MNFCPNCGKSGGNERCARCAQNIIQSCVEVVTDCDTPPVAPAGFKLTDTYTQAFPKRIPLRTRLKAAWHELLRRGETQIHTHRFRAGAEPGETIVVPDEIYRQFNGPPPGGYESLQQVRA